MTIKEIQDNILAEKAKFSELDSLNSNSKVSVYRLWVYITAVVAWSVYQFFDAFKAEMDEVVKTQKRYTLRDFRNMALEFRYGHQLNDETGSYDEGVYSDDQIEIAKIIKRAAIIELELNNRKHLFIKVATEDGNGDLAKLSDAQKTALNQYFARIKPAGTKIIIFTDNADDLKITLDFYYDPLILNSDGERIDGQGTTPIQNEIRAYLKELKFNGEFTIAELENRLQTINGAADEEVYIRNCEANFKTPVEWLTITSNYIANSGYMKIDDENLVINFIPKNVAL